MIDVIVTEGFDAWFGLLEQSEAESVVFAIELLRETSSEKSPVGAFVDVQGLRAMLRVYFTFDARRREVVLLHGVHHHPHSTPAHALA